MSEALTYNDGTKTVVQLGDVVMAPGGMRGIVFGIEGIVLKVLGIGRSNDSGDMIVLSPRAVHEYPASACSYLPKQILDL